MWPSYGNISHGGGWEEIGKKSACCCPQSPSAKPFADRQLANGAALCFYLDPFALLSHVGRYFRRSLSVFTPFLSLSGEPSAKRSLIALNRSFGPRDPTPPRNVPDFCRGNDWEDAEHEDAGRGGFSWGNKREEGSLFKPALKAVALTWSWLGLASGIPDAMASRLEDTCQQGLCSEALGSGIERHPTGECKCSLYSGASTYKRLYI